MPLVHWPPAWRPLADALAPGLAAGDALAWPAAGLFVEEGPAPPGRLGLDPGLREGPLFQGEDADLQAAGLPGALDRFRRLTGLVLEAGALLGAHGPAAWDDPWAWAAAALAVDRAVPALGWLQGAAVGLARRPEESADPRRLAWYLRWAAANGGEVPPREEDWARFGLWVRDRARGPLSTLWAPVDPIPPRPLTASEWQAAPRSHRVLALEGGAAGRTFSLRGPGALVGQTAASPGQVGLALAGSVRGGALLLRREGAGPQGSWTLRSGAYGTTVGAARGVELTLHEDGRLDLVGADAFVGRLTPALLDMAQQVGVSGEADGRWALSSLSADGRSGLLRVSGLSLGTATLHPRKGRRYALPADDLLGPVRSVLALLNEVPLRWTLGLDEGGPTLTLAAPWGGAALEFFFGATPLGPAGLES